MYITYITLLEAKSSSFSKSLILELNSCVWNQKMYLVCKGFAYWCRGDIRNRNHRTSGDRCICSHQLLQSRVYVGGRLSWAAHRLWSRQRLQISKKSKENSEGIIRVNWEFSIFLGIGLNIHDSWGDDWLMDSNVGFKSWRKPGIYH